MLGVLAAAICSACREEAADTLMSGLEAVFGPSFHIGGLGGVLTCGVTGLRAGMSRAAQPSVRPRLACSSHARCSLHSCKLIIYRAVGPLFLCWGAPELLTGILCCVACTLRTTEASCSQMAEHRHPVCLPAVPAHRGQSRHAVQRRPTAESGTSSSRSRSSASMLPAASAPSSGRGKRVHQAPAVLSKRLSSTSNSRG